MRIRLFAVLSIALLLGLLAPSATTQETRARPEAIVLEGCLVSVTTEVEIPAQEDGVLQDLLVEEGSQVKAGDLLAQIDDTLAKLQLTVAEAELAVSKKEANNTTNVEYSKAASLVAKAEYDAAIVANNKKANTFPDTDVRKLLLTYHRSLWEIEKAQMDLEIAGLQVNVSQAKLDAAAEGIKRRQIKCPPETLAEGQAPPEGVVQELYHHQGEWVKQGEPVMHIIRADRLWVEQFLQQTVYNMGDVYGRPVTVRVNLAGGEQATFKGKIVLTELMVRGTGEYKVRAEVENRKDPQGFWLLRPGLRAEMTIQLK
jgi:multidrug efflux pump subunit AcrA (membrane-fusion protein)